MKQRKEGKKLSSPPPGISPELTPKTRNRPSKIPRSLLNPLKVNENRLKLSPRSNLTNLKSLTPREMSSNWDEPSVSFEPVTSGSQKPTSGSPPPRDVQSPISSRLSGSTSPTQGDARKRKGSSLTSGPPAGVKKRAFSPEPNLTPGPIRTLIPRLVTTPRVTSLPVHENPKKRGLSPDIPVPRPKTIPTKKTKPTGSRTGSSPSIDHWINQYQTWSDQDQKIALKKLIDLAAPNNVRYMREVIEPRFQRDFISLLPRELALHVLSNLTPVDLMGCAQTCRTWRQLADDNLLWRQKCQEENITDCTPKIRKNFHNWEVRQDAKNCDSLDISGLNHHSPWKAAFLRKKRIETAWQTGNVTARELIGHDDHVVTCLQFDGNRIVSGSDDNTLKVWNADSGYCSATLTGHTGGVWCLEMKDDLIVSGSTDRTLKVWRADTGECVETLYGHASTVRCMAMHGNQVVSGSRDNTLRLWDISTFECKTVLIGHLAAVRCVCFDGKKVVSGSYDNTVKIWDPFKPSGSKLLFTLQGHQQRVYSLQFDGTHVVSGSLDTNIMVWDANTGLLLHTLTGHQSLTSGMELRDHTLVSGNADSTVKIWDIATGYLIRTLDGKFKHESAVTSLQYNGRFIITSSDDGTVKLWSSETGRQIRDLVSLDSRRNGGVVWRIKASETKLVCAVGSRNGTEITKLLVLDFDEPNSGENSKEITAGYGHDVEDGDVQVSGLNANNSLGHVNPT